MDETCNFFQVIVPVSPAQVAWLPACRAWTKTSSKTPISAGRRQKRQRHIGANPGRWIRLSSILNWLLSKDIWLCYERTRVCFSMCTMSNIWPCPEWGLSLLSRRFQTPAPSRYLLLATVIYGCFPAPCTSATGILRFSHCPCLKNKKENWYSVMAGVYYYIVNIPLFHMLLWILLSHRVPLRHVLIIHIK